MGLAEDTAVRDEGGKLAATLSRNWEIWGPNGGYISAIALRAAGKVAPPDHRPATFSAQYLSAGQFSDAEVAAEAVKKGRNAWCINVALSQAGRRFLQAQVWTTNKSDGPQVRGRKMPEVPPHGSLKSWRELFARKEDDGPHFRFWDNFEGKPVRQRQVNDFDPRGGVLEEWYRYLNFAPAADPFLDSARALILIDTLQWPAFCRGLAAQPSYIAPSLDVTAWFHDRPGDAEWLLAKAHADSALGGLIQGGVEIWSGDGRLIATGGSTMLHVARG
ncbi:MAG TPA: thioesterase family protein [Rhizomicrobium sp.]|jgi:acyl-CoA thioesterase|nr:thioesterase family protein [Rhizomicrobium sp.]